MTNAMNDQEAIDALVAELTKKDKQEKPQENPKRNGFFAPPDVEKAIEVLKRDPTRLALFNGSNEGYPSESEADAAFFHHVAFFGRKDPQVMEEIARRSARVRKKWDTKRGGTTWLRWELQKAAERVNDVWTKGDSSGANLRINRKKEEGEKQEIPPVSNPLRAGLVNLAEIIENGIEDPEELVPGILLKGRVHHLYAPAAVGKTYLSLWLATRCLEDGRRVLYIDAENGGRIISERLEQMGVPTQEIADHLSYLPFPTLDTTPTSLQNYVELIEEFAPELVIFDSWIKFLSAAGLEENDNDHIARWATHFAQPLRNMGITSLILDHVPHDATRSRGASRKKDEVDVQYHLVKTKHFNRTTVGEVNLKLEKDREGWLPEITTFSVGGRLDGGFVFSKSSGTSGPGLVLLKDKEKKVLEVLKSEFGVDGARYSEWRKSCVPAAMSKATFDRARDELIRSHLVRRGEGPDETKYYPQDFWGGLMGDETTQSPLMSQIPDRSHLVSSRSHETAGDGEVSQVSHPLRGETMRPTGEPTDPVATDDDQIKRVKAAFEYGNIPKKALKDYCNGSTDLASVVRAVMRYYTPKGNDIERWYGPVQEVVEARLGKQPDKSSKNLLDLSAESTEDESPPVEDSLPTPDNDEPWGR